jgi:hypothetical protein
MVVLARPPAETGHPTTPKRLRVPELIVPNAMLEPVRPRFFTGDVKVILGKASGK